MTKLTKLRQMADYLYEIAEDGASGLDKTAAEVEAEMHVYLESELGPLLRAADELIADYHPVAGGGSRLMDELKKELAKWKR